MPREKLTVFVEGIFFSHLYYCLEIFGNVWGLSTYDETSRNSTAFRKEDNQKLQVLVNKVLGSLTGLDKYTSAAVICSTAGQLSVHQRTALLTLTSVHKALNRKEPSYTNFYLNSTDAQDVRQLTNCKRVEYDLSISRCSFFYRGSPLYNRIPPSMTKITEQSALKMSAKQWVKDNISLKPP